MISNLQVFDIIIIGGGPAGLFTAVNLKNDTSPQTSLNQLKSNKKVLILEKNETAGKKLLMAGSGRCNITHFGNIEEFFKHYGENQGFLKPALKEFTNYHLIAFLKKREIDILVDKNGKVFPDSENSRDILELLLNECKKNKIEIKYNESVVNLIKSKEKFYIKTKTNEYICSNVVIASGGKSYPLSGSSGDGYRLAKSVGHTIIPPKPALSPVFIKDYKFVEISGVSLEKREIFLYRNNKKLKAHCGDFCFTHFGLSGPGILDFSRYIEPNDVIKINLINQKPEDFKRMFMETSIKDGKRTLKGFIKRFKIPVSLIKVVLSEQNLVGDEQLASIKKEIRNRIIDLFCEHPFTVERTGDFNIAMVTKGGVSLNEVFSKTMESKLTNGLFFAGEVLDIDGDTGGYNLQAAFSTSYLAAKSINQKM